MEDNYKNYGEIDYEDHEIENKIEMEEKLNNELNPEMNDGTRLK